MPKFKRGSGGGSHGKKVKAGTHNRKQASLRDERRAAAIAAVRTMADKALEKLLSPQPAPPEEVESPATEPTYEPSKGTMDARRREAIVLKYELLTTVLVCAYGVQETVWQGPGEAQGRRECEMWAHFHRDPVHAVGVTKYTVCVRKSHNHIIGVVCGVGTV